MRELFVALVCFLVALSSFAGNKKSPCSYESWPIAVGAEWELASTSKTTLADGTPNVVTSTHKEKVLAIDGEGFDVELTVPHVDPYKLHYRCTAGGPMPVMPAQGETAGTDSGSHYPLKLKVGHAWVARQFMKIGEDEMSIVSNYKIVAVEKVTVPAGTYDAYRADFDRTTSMPGGFRSTDSGSTWFAKNVGMVKSVTRSVFDDPNLEKPVESEATSELVAYRKKK